jgi:hypothetical protein
MGELVAALRRIYRTGWVPLPLPLFIKIVELQTKVSQIFEFKGVIVKI